jgi:hypothetical protein
MGIDVETALPQSLQFLGFLSLEWVEPPPNPSRYFFRSFVPVVSWDKPSNKGVIGQVTTVKYTCIHNLVARIFPF